MQTRARRRRRRQEDTFPDLSPFDLFDSIDIHNAHELLVATGHGHDSYDGLEQTTLAAVLARRLAKGSVAAYFAHILKHGFSRFGPADKDRAAAKRIIREIYRE